jgi:hypothetical protein
MARKSTEIKTINDVHASILDNNFAVTGTTNEIDITTSAGSGNGPGTVEIGISSAFTGGAGTVDVFLAEANTGTTDHTNDAGTTYNINNGTGSPSDTWNFICWKYEQKKDAIYTHSTSSSSEVVTITEAGIYMIFYSVRTDNLDDNRFVAEAGIHHDQGSGYSMRDFTRATSYSRGSSGGGIYDYDIQLNYAGLLEMAAGDLVKLGVRRNDADDTSQNVRIQTDGTMLTLVRVKAVGNKTNVITVSSGTTTLTNAQSASVVYATGGAVTLPASIEKGVQFVVVNDSGGNLTINLNSNTAAIAGHGVLANQSSRTYVAVSDGNVAHIG